ncbi:MAG TPA: hypothetical protein VGQ83_15290 [Polyangia bacterium]|jgi:hypothetical protein
MILLDTSVVIYAHRAELPEHDGYARWLTAVAAGADPFGLSELALSALVRIVTNPGVFRTPTPLATA